MSVAHSRGFFGAQKAVKHLSHRLQGPHWRIGPSAAIEFGEVTNTTGPIDGDEDDSWPSNASPRMSMGMNRNVPSPSAVTPVVLQGQWTASAGAPLPLTNYLDIPSMHNLLSASAGAGVGPGGGMDMAAA
ncbi:hypothetical protein BJY52DRAFT_1189515 [Lactarius psammicola]|nr:hypothetical protein BJY52DRAFT_1189515 [Lactarius psammicola]